MSLPLPPKIRLHTIAAGSPWFRIHRCRDAMALQLPVCQAWSRWWHDAAEQPDGLLYPSRLLPRGSNLALYEHCSDGWEEKPLGDLMHWREGNGEPAVLEILDAHRWGLVD